MEPITIASIVSVISAIAAILAGITARRKVGAEADSVIVASAENVVELVNKQLGVMEDKVEGLQKTVQQYRAEVEAAALSEATLRKELDRLRRRVVILEDFIRNSGLTIPSNGTDTPLN